MYNCLAVHVHETDGVAEITGWPVHFSDFARLALRYWPDVELRINYSSRHAKFLRQAWPNLRPLVKRRSLVCKVTEMRAFEGTFNTLAGETWLLGKRYGAWPRTQLSWRFAHRPPRFLSERNAPFLAKIHDDDFFDGYFCSTAKARGLVGYLAASFMANVHGPGYFEATSRRYLRVAALTPWAGIPPHIERRIFSFAKRFGLTFHVSDLSVKDAALRAHIWLGGIGLLAAPGHPSINELNRYITLQYVPKNSEWSLGAVVRRPCPHSSTDIALHPD